jgi:hypothetical protein
MSNNMQKNTQSLVSIEKSTSMTIELSINALTQLLENLKNYQNCVDDYFQIQKNYPDTDNKDDIARYSQSHTLPGVISFPQILQSNTDQTEQIRKNAEATLNQKRIFFRLIEKNSNIYSEAFKQLKINDGYFEEFIDILNGNINLNLQPQRFVHQPKNQSTTLEVKKSVNNKKK